MNDARTRVFAVLVGVRGSLPRRSTGTRPVNAGFPHYLLVEWQCNSFIFGCVLSNVLVVHC
jgi:hypothetical protein